MILLKQNIPKKCQKGKYLGGFQPSDSNFALTRSLCRRCPTFGALPQSIVVKVRIYSYDGGNADDGSSCMPAKSLLAGAKASGGGAKAVKSGSVSQDEPPRELVQALLDEFPHSNEKQARRRPGARSSAYLWVLRKSTWRRSSTCISHAVSTRWKRALLAPPRSLDDDDADDGEHHAQRQTSSSWWHGSERVRTRGTFTALQQHEHVRQRSQRRQCKHDWRCSRLGSDRRAACKCTVKMANAATICSYFSCKPAGAA